MQSVQNKNIAIFASGTGSNAVNICKYFMNRSNIQVKTLVCNKAKAKVIENVKLFNLQVVLIDKTDFAHPEKLIQQLQKQAIDLLVLAGFLWLIPETIIKAYPNKIINLHPALLPKYGGKGMYGARVHQAVLDNKENESGITIHYVNEAYDEGKIIFQADVELQPQDTPNIIAQKVLNLEHKHFPIIIEETLKRSQQMD